MLIRLGMMTSMQFWQYNSSVLLAAGQLQWSSPLTGFYFLSERSGKDEVCAECSSSRMADTSYHGSTSSCDRQMVETCLTPPYAHPVCHVTVSCKDMCCAKTYCAKTCLVSNNTLWSHLIVGGGNKIYHRQHRLNPLALLLVASCTWV